MGKSLVIVESPAKARTINKYLGREYLVKSSVGHVRDLPKSGRGQRKRQKVAPSGPLEEGLEKKSRQNQDRNWLNLIRRMGVDPENNWVAHYEILPDKQKVIDELRKQAGKADAIYLATDLDREGEAIAWHLREVIDGEADRFKRVTFSEITKKAIQEAFRRPSTINMNRVRAQQARRFLDRVVGYMLSPLLWKKLARNLSAGRVQSVAVRLVTEREREIHAFIPEEYWEIFTDLKRGTKGLRAKVFRHRGGTFKPRNQEEADRARADLEQAAYRVAKKDEKPTTKRPSPPFITSTLQQTASVRLGFGVKKTMVLAQRLYEAGHITYMRTDSTNLSADAVAGCRSHIARSFGREYLPDSPRVYRSKETAQEAHEAIPGRVMRFDGWMRVMPPVTKKGDEDVRLPDLKVGDELKLVKVDPTQHFTKPPPRYNEASLVKELEKRGIGRPSTYASIISTIQDRGYVRLENRRFYAEKMGDIVTERLLEHFDEIMDYNFTAALEEQLDAIAGGELDWREALDSFYRRFKQDLEKASESMRENRPTLTDIPCPACGRPMAIRTARTGVFLSCSGYDLPAKERCKNTINLIRGEEAEHAGEDDEQEAKRLLTSHRCPKCGTAMDSYLIDENRRLHICGNNPDCDGFRVEKGKFKLKGYDGPVITCDKCGADMELKTGRYGKFFRCTRYPECGNTRKLLRNGQPAPPKMDPVPMPELPCEKSDGHFILRDGAAGVFLASSLFPKSRETKSPAVEDLKRHRDELDPKYHFLADAPATDPDGNRFLIRFKRKEKAHYLVSEIDGNANTWTAVLEDGEWVMKKKGVREKKTSGGSRRRRGS